MARAFNMPAELLAYIALESENPPHRANLIAAMCSLQWAIQNNLVTKAIANDPARAARWVHEEMPKHAEAFAKESVEQVRRVQLLDLVQSMFPTPADKMREEGTRVGRLLGLPEWVFSILKDDVFFSTVMIVSLGQYGVFREVYSAKEFTSNPVEATLSIPTEILAEFKYNVQK